mmetsp:Transcript_11488/g.16509  ORF Transcript_11488/g.16509 Transcript_11488/m.16509 type:complete len:137 (+) Transcript_11488:51-461(+)
MYIVYCTGHPAPTNSSCAANEKLAAAQREKNPAAFVCKLVQDVVTRWGSTYKQVERILVLEEAIKDMFKKEFRNRTSLTQPTLLEKYALSEEDFDGLRNIKRVLEPFQKAQCSIRRRQIFHYELSTIFNSSASKRT